MQIPPIQSVAIGSVPPNPSLQSQHWLPNAVSVASRTSGSLWHQPPAVLSSTCPLPSSSSTAVVTAASAGRSSGPAAAGGVVFVRQRNKGILCKQHLAAWTSSNAASGCPRGFDCPYMHAAPGQPRLLPDAVCNFYLNSVCLKDNCRFFHGRIERLQQLKAAGATHYLLEDEMITRDPPPVPPAPPAELVFAGLKKPMVQHATSQQPPQQQHVFFPMLIPAESSPTIGGGVSGQTPLKTTASGTTELQQTSEQERTKKWVQDQEDVRGSVISEDPSPMANSTCGGAATLLRPSPSAAAEAVMVNQKIRPPPASSPMTMTAGFVSSSDDAVTAEESPFDADAASSSNLNHRNRSSQGDVRSFRGGPEVVSVTMSAASRPPHHAAGCCDSGSVDDSSRSKEITTSPATAARGSGDEAGSSSATNATPLDCSNGAMLPLQNQSSCDSSSPFLASLAPAGSDGNRRAIGEARPAIVTRHDVVLVEASSRLSSDSPPSDPAIQPSLETSSSAIPQAAMSTSNLSRLFSPQRLSAEGSALGFGASSTSIPSHRSLPAGMPSASGRAATGPATSPSSLIMIPNGPVIYTSAVTDARVTSATPPDGSSWRPTAANRTPIGACGNVVLGLGGCGNEYHAALGLAPMSSQSVHVDATVQQQQQPTFATMQQVLWEQQQLIHIQQQQLLLQQQIQQQLMQQQQQQPSSNTAPVWTTTAVSSVAPPPSVAFSHSAFSGVTSVGLPSVAATASLHLPQAPVGHLSNHTFHHAAHMPTLPTSSYQNLQQQTPVMPFPPLSSAVPPPSIPSSSTAWSASNAAAVQQQALFAAPHHHHYHASLPLQYLSHFATPSV